MRTGALERVFHHGVDARDAVEQAGDRQVFLLPEIVGDARRDEADAARHVRERHALDAVAIQDLARSRDDRLLLARVAGGGSRCDVGVRAEIVF